MQTIEDYLLSQLDQPVVLKDGSTVGYSFMAVAFAAFATKLGQVAKAIMDENGNTNNTN